MKSLFLIDKKHDFARFLFAFSFLYGKCALFFISPNPMKKARSPLLRAFFVFEKFISRQDFLICAIYSGFLFVCMV